MDLSDLKDRETERQRDRETERQRDRETERQRDRETERDKDKWYEAGAALYDIFGMKGENELHSINVMTK